MIRILILAVMFLSAFLLFIIQPLYAKYMLPYFGGTSSVWTISVFFYSVVLLLGYLYATLLMRWRYKYIWVLHAALLLAATAMLAVRWLQFGSPLLVDAVVTSAPAISVLLTLLASVAFPVVLLSSTSVIAQSLYARYTKQDPYKLFVVSNAGSLLGLLAYPFIFEPFSTLSTQAYFWVAGFVLFSICLVSVWILIQWVESEKEEREQATLNVVLQHRSLILLMSAIPTFLLASMTEYLSKGIASFPLMWIIPLALYLISFMVAFQPQLQKPRLFPFGFVTFLPLLLVLLVVPLMGVHVVVYWFGFLCMMTAFFLVSVYSHRRVYEMRPSVHDLGTFYVYMTIGGALGSGIVGLLLPLVLDDAVELHIALSALLLYFLWHQSLWLQRYIHSVVLRIMQGAVTLLAVVYLGQFLLPWDTIAHERNFYGTIKVTEQMRMIDGEALPVRVEVNGNTDHGMQVQKEDYQGDVGSYYGKEAGVGVALRSFYENGTAPRVAVVGLGAGMLNAYCDKAASVSYIEINPAVVDFAYRYFTYLDKCPDTTSVTVGDGRLELEKLAIRQNEKFDVIVIDAFTDDAIPPHLLTSEAFVRAYQPLLSPRGIIAFHVTNRYLNLYPPIIGMARAHGFEAVVIEYKKAGEKAVQLSSHWVLVTSPENAQALSSFENVQPYSGETFVWRDDRNTVLDVLSLKGSWR